MNNTTCIAWVLVAVAAFAIGRSGEKTSLRDAEAEGQVRSAQRASAPGPQFKFSQQSVRLACKGAHSLAGGPASTGVTAACYLQEEDVLEANRLLAELLLDLDAKGARELFAALRARGGKEFENRQQVGLLLVAWGRIDGPAAMQAAAEVAGDGGRRGLAARAARGVAARSAMRGWARTDPEAAKAHLAQVEDDWERNTLREGLVSGWAAVDPAAATAYVLEVEARQRTAHEGRERRGVRTRNLALDRQVEAIAQVQLQRGIEEATAWAATLPEGAVKSSALARVASWIADEELQSETFDSANPRPLTR